MSEQKDIQGAPGSSWLEERLARLDAVYRRFGREGLQEYPLQDISLLLSAKELEYRDAPKGRDQTEAQKAENRRLELEIKDLASHLNAYLAGASLQGRKSTPGYNRVLDEAARRGEFRQRSPGKGHER
ncbi:MAG TPA: hypothetical protein PKD86_08440 [Gemmatales bacterium]|nr:hypothetical protein [Gemmatales bacterium]